MDFPADLPTNSYVLEGSSDIAYAICVLARTGISGLPELVKPGLESSPGNGIERLRAAENELRKARILVSLDELKGELFTFYRKEDLQRDAKSIFNRVVTILRKNECHMSSKNAIKTADLLRPDRAKLHHLFVHAILCMIKSVVKQNKSLVALDINTFLFRTPLCPHHPSGYIHELEDVWRLFELTAQLLPNGQVIAINRQNTSSMFECVSSSSLTEQTGLYHGKPMKVLLAATGQYARYTGGYRGKLPRPFDAGASGANPPNHNRETTLEKYRQEIWKASVKQWLAENELSFSMEKDDWIEVELPLCEIDTEHSPSPQGCAQIEEIIWKPVFWPTSLCYVNAITQPLTDDDSISHHFEDPLQFVQDWMESTADREAVLKKMEQGMEVSIKPEGVDDISHNDSIHVDAGQALRCVASLDGQAAMAIYPTPPDGALSQVTPGVFSVDGTSATPGDGTVPNQPDRTGNGVQMMDLIEGQAAIGSGLYDEDLFEDIPGEKFGEAEMADEPNWDFFDEPDADTIEDVDHMELDIPEKVTSAAAQSRTLSHPETGRAMNEIADVLPEFQSGMKLLEPEKLSIAESMPIAKDETSRIPEDHLEGQDIIETRLAGPTYQPLSPTEVKKRFFRDMANLNPSEAQQTIRSEPSRRILLKDHFDSDTFQPQLKIADSRYDADGSFWFESNEGRQTSATGLVEQYPSVPRIGIPKRELSTSVPKNPGTSRTPSSSSSVEDTDFDSSGFFPEANKHGSPDKQDGEETCPSAIQPQLADDILDGDTESKFREEVARLLELLRPDIREQLFDSQHQPLRRHVNDGIPISGEKLLTVAHVMVEQVSQSSFNHEQPDNPSSGSEKLNLVISQRLQSIYGDSSELEVAKLAELSMDGQDAADGDGLTDSPSPLIRLARSDTNIDALPTMQPFWETLGLQPVNGSKSIVAFCVHPAVTHIGEGSSAFLQRFSEIYSNCNLGSHNNGNIEEVTNNGLIEWDVGKGARIDTLVKLCEQLGSSLTALPSSAENVMIYIVNPFGDGSAMANICTAFVALFTSYAMACGKSKVNELNLQILPMSFIASPDAVVIPSQAEYLSLALEVYNRCRSTKSTGTAAESGAAVTLAEPVPKNIIFNLASDATSPLSKDGPVLHLAYSQSVDLRWIIACWTDNLGRTALTMTYCLRQKGSSASRSRSEVVKEMWEISQDIMIKTRGKWRLSVGHDGPIEPDEINEWSFLANQNVSDGLLSHCVLTLLTFNEHPSIQFFPPAPQNKLQPPPPATATISGKYGTPASTPSAAPMTSSPEQFTAPTPIPPTPGASGSLTAPTPPDQNNQSQAHGFDTSADPDATLSDPTDECWSLLLPFGLNNSSSPLDSRPALLSGFLLKRRGALDSDGLVALEVNLIYTSTANASKVEHKILLREVIEQWRGLYTLTKTKGLGGPGSVLPWHVRTALVGCRAVSKVL